MSFIADKQTLEDMNLMGKYKPNSVYSIFNQVRTAGGERLLDEMFRHPLKDPESINLRSSIFRYFQDNNLEFPFKGEEFNVIENYLSMGTAGNRVAVMTGVFYKKISEYLLRDDQFKTLYAGLLHAIEGLKSLREFFNALKEDDHPYKNQLRKAKAIFADIRLAWLSSPDHVTDLSLIKVAKYDCILRNTLRKEVQQLLEIVYDLDVYIAVSNVAKARNLTYALALPKEANQFKAKGLRHPALEKAVGNPLIFNQAKNFLFLTGANMAGKSTFMKAFGLSVYMAHMGFPIAADEMTFSVKEGLYSSINVPDNLSLGLSHFYAEVLRVKCVAEEVASGKQLVVIFDELFKGTNVKDAYDATLAVTRSFSKYRNCLFIISTHIIEVGAALGEGCENIQLAYLPTVMDGNVPKYTYQLKEGITSDRQGMMIIENENILELILGK